MPRNILKSEASSHLAQHCRHLRNLKNSLDRPACKQGTEEISGIVWPKMIRRGRQRNALQHQRENRRIHSACQRTTANIRPVPQTPSRTTTKPMVSCWRPSRPILPEIQRQHTRQNEGSCPKPSWWLQVTPKAKYLRPPRSSIRRTHGAISIVRWSVD